MNFAPPHSCMDLARPTEEQLRDLEQACAPATFGRNQEDVLDETYRKAGKMDNTDFCVTYTPPEDILGLVRYELYEESECQLRYELYKLNVYGECFDDSTIYFCAHVS